MVIHPKKSHLPVEKVAGLGFPIWESSTPRQRVAIQRVFHVLSSGLNRRLCKKAVAAEGPRMARLFEAT
jgi:hypothetical protein